MGDVRASDHERERTATELRDHYAAGRLSLEELERRLERVWRAVWRRDLREQLRGLPSGRWRRMALVAYRLQRAALFAGIAFFAAFNAMLVGIWELTGGGDFWPAWSIVPGALMLLCHAYGSRAFARALGLGRRRRLRA